MRKYKFKVGQEVYPVGLKRVFVEGGKHHQKWSGKIVSRHYCDVREINVYLVKTTLGMLMAHERSLTAQKEKQLCYLLIRDVNDYVKYAEKPEVIPAGSKLISLRMIPHD
jgi:hypothetical protein